MTEYIRKQDAVNSVECANGNITWAERDDCKKRLEELSPADVVSVSAYNRVMLERDAAIEQLKQVSKDLREVMDDVAHVQRLLSFIS